MKINNGVYYLLAILLIALGAAPTVYAIPVTWTIMDRPQLTGPYGSNIKGDISGWFTTDSTAQTWAITSYHLETKYSHDTNLGLSYNSSEPNDFVDYTLDGPVFKKATGSELTLAFLPGTDGIPTTDNIGITVPFAWAMEIYYVTPSEGFGARADEPYQGTFGQGNPIPEPTTMLLLGSGLIVLAGFKRRFKK